MRESNKSPNHDINLKNLSLKDRKYYKEIVEESSRLFHILEINGAISILFNNNNGIHHCLAYVTINNETIPIFITSTLKELRNRLIYFIEFIALFDLNGLGDLDRFLDALRDYKTDSIVVSGKLKMLEIDLIAFAETVGEKFHKKANNLTEAYAPNVSNKIH